jgi:hypothetical protein
MQVTGPISERVLGRFHELDQHAAHVLGVNEDDQRTMGADARLAQHGGALGDQAVAGLVDVLDLEADVVLAALGVLGQEAVDRRGLAIGLDQLDLAVGQVDERQTHLTSAQQVLIFTASMPTLSSVT